MYYIKCRKWYLTFSRECILYYSTQTQTHIFFFICFVLIVFFEASLSLSYLSSVFRWIFCFVFLRSDGLAAIVFTSCYSILLYVPQQNIGISSWNLTVNDLFYRIVVVLLLLLLLPLHTVVDAVALVVCCCCRFGCVFASISNSAFGPHVQFDAEEFTSYVC